MTRIRAELHSHSLVSDGSMDPSYIVKLARKVGCDVLAVTDHDTFEGSFKAIKAVKFYDIENLIVVPASEVRTSWGDVLVYCPRPPEGEAPRDPYDLRDWSDENNCILVPAHPLHPLRVSVGLKRLKEGRDLWDAIEVWNSRGLVLINYITYVVSREFGLPLTSGSDAHVPSELCTSPSIIELDVMSADDVIDSIRKGRVAPTLGVESVKARLESIVWAIERRIL